MAQNILLRVVSTDGATQTYSISGVSKESLSIKAKADSKYALLNDNTVANASEQLKPAGGANKTVLKLKKVNNDLLMTSEDEVSQITIENFYTQPNVSIAGDAFTLEGQNISLVRDATGSYVVPLEQTASLAVAAAPLVGSNTALYGLAGVGALAAASGGGGGGGSSGGDKTPPASPTLAQSNGSSNGATKDEALAGAVSVTAEAGSRVKVTFTDTNNRSVIKNITATGTQQAVTLAATDFGTGTNQLGDGVITVKAVATDAAGNSSSEATSNFTLDTLAPKLSTTVLPTISKTALTGTAGDSVDETIAVTLTFDSVVDGLTNGTNNTVFKVGTAFVTATWSGTAPSNTRTLTYKIQTGDNGQAIIDEVALKAALVAGLKDAAGNAFDSTAIADIDVANNVLPVVVTLGPKPPTLVESNGSSNGVTREEALAGALSVSAEVGSTIKVTFTDTNNRSVTKNIPGTGTVQLVKLDAADFGTGPGQLGDGAITVKAIATDTAGNSSGEVTGNFTLDTVAPKLSATVLPTISKTALTGIAGDGVGETIALTLTFDSVVDGLTSGTNTSVFYVDTRFVDATWSGKADTNTRTLIYTIQKGDNGQAGIDEVALKAALVAGLKDAAGNAFDSTALIPDIDVVNNVLPFVDTLGPTSPTLVQVSGVSKGVTREEALAGALNVSAEVGSTIKVTFTDSNNRVVTKTYMAEAGAQAVKLDAADFGTGPGQLGDGAITVKAIATDTAGNSSIEATSDFTLDTLAPKLGATVDPKISKSTVAGTAGDSVGETIALTLTFDSVVDGLTNGTNKNVFKVGAAFVDATWSGTAGTNTRTLTYTIQQGDKGQASIDEVGLKFALVLGLKDAAGNAFDSTVTIPNIDVANNVLPTVDTSEPSTPSLIQSNAAINGATKDEALAGAVNVTAEAGSTIKVTFTDTNNRSVIKNITATGTPQLVKLEAADFGTGPGQLGDGAITVKAIATDTAGNSSGEVTGNFTLDTLAPKLSATPLPTISKSTVAGTAGDSVGETIALTLTFDSVVNGLTSGTNNTVFKVGTAFVDATWSGNPTSNTRTLTYTIQTGHNGQAIIDEVALKAALVAGLKDAAGNAFDSTVTIADIDVANNVLPTVDTIAAAAPLIQLAAASDTGQSNSDGQTNNTKPTLSGTGEVGATVKIRDGSNGGTVVATAVVGSGGTWSATVTSALSEGVHQLYASIEDAAGNLTTPTTGGKVLARSSGLEDLSTRGTPGVTVGGVLSATNATGEAAVGVTVLNAEGGFISHNNYKIYDGGAAESTNLKNKLSENFTTGQQVIITTYDEWATRMTAEARAALASIGATRSIIDSAQFRSSYLMITTRSANGWRVDYEQYNKNKASTSLEAYADSDIQTVNIDTQAPSAVDMGLTAAASGGRSNIKTPTLSGTGEVGATVRIREGSNTGTEVATAVVGADGTWSTKVTTPLTEGVHQLFASIQDIAGNIASPLAEGGVVAISRANGGIVTTGKVGVRIGSIQNEVNRGLGLSVLTKDGALKSHEEIDPFKNDQSVDVAKSNSLISKLNTTNYEVGEKIIITTNDDWVSGFNNDARNALIGIGASADLIGLDANGATRAKFRSAFVMITQKTSNGWVVDYQDYQLDGTTAPLVAYGDSNIQTVKILPGATNLLPDSPFQSDSTGEFGAMDASLVYNGNTYVMVKSKLNHDVLDAKLGNGGGDTTVTLTESTKTAVKGVDTSYASVLKDGKTYVLLDTVELKEVLQQANSTLWDASTKLSSGEGFWAANQTDSNAHAYIADATHQVYAGADALEKWTVFKVL